MLIRYYARHNVRSLRKEEEPGRRFIVIDSVNSFPLPADGSEAILGVPMREERGDCIWMWISLLCLPTYPTNAADNAVVAAAAPTVLLSPLSLPLLPPYD